MDDLPELPFEQILSYLSLEDRLKARAVSKGWRKKFDGYPAKSLCFSEHPSGFIFGKSRLVSGVFVQNFISFHCFESFFNTFGRQMILSSLKHLRLCDLNSRIESDAGFAEILQSFAQLEQLDIIRLEMWQATLEIELNLPMLCSLRLEVVKGFLQLTLNAPSLKRVILSNFLLTLHLHLVHAESVETLITSNIHSLEVKKLKKLRYLYLQNYMIDPTLLADLQELEELYLQDTIDGLFELFEQKQRRGLSDLKIFQSGCLLNGPHDPVRTMNWDCLNDETFVQIAENPSMLAEQIPFNSALHYHQIERVASESQLSFLNRLVDLEELGVDLPVQDIDRFLALLKNFRHITDLQFRFDQPQDLFDRLPEYCAVQKLTLHYPPSDLAFLFELKQLIVVELRYVWQIDAESIWKAFDELPFLSLFRFYYRPENSIKTISIEADRPNRFKISVDATEKSIVPDLNSAIQLITNDLN